MKKILAFFILLIFICPISEINAITSKQNVQPPKWEDYVPTKYQVSLIKEKILRNYPLVYF